MTSPRWLQTAADVLEWWHPLAWSDPSDDLARVRRRVRDADAGWRAWAALRGRGTTLTTAATLVRDEETTPALGALRAAADRLSVRGGAPTPRWTSGGRWWSDAEAVHELDRFAPPDVLVAVAARELLETPSEFLVDTAPEPLRRILEQELMVTDAHVHLALAAPADGLWRFLPEVLQFVDPREAVAALRAARGVLGNDEVPAQEYLARMYAGQFLRLALWQHTRPGAPIPDRDGLLEAESGRSSIHSRVIRRTLTSVLDGTAIVDDPWLLRDAWRSRFPIPYVPSTLGDRDPLGERGEERLLHRIARYLDGEPPAGPLRRAAQQYLRVRFLHHLWNVQRPGVGGLHWFTMTKDAVAVLRPDGVHLASALFADPHLNAAAPRCAPDRDAARLVRGALSLLAGARPDQEVGVVYHWSRRRSDWQEWSKDARKSLRALEIALASVPVLVGLIRGLDVCSNETAGPPWFVLRQTLLQARHYGEQAARRSVHEFPWIRPPRLTIHVGEDFHHPLEGLRRIDEVLDDLVPGDRIGHALALRPVEVPATPPRQPRIDALLDLAWEREIVRRKRVAVDARRLLSYQAWLDEWAPGWEEKHLDLLWSSVVRARVGLDRDHGLMRVKDRNGRELLSLDWWELVAGHHAIDGAFVESCRAAVSKRVAESLVVVETMPSSNVSVGDFASPLDGPAEFFDAMGIVVTVGSDDPTSFATRISREYVRLAAADAARGMAAAGIVERWRTRTETAWGCRLTEPQSADQEFRDVLRRRAGAWGQRSARWANEPVESDPPEEWP